VSFWKTVVRRTASGVQAIVRSRIEALPRRMQTALTLSCAPERGRLFYIDRENGSDETGDGSKENPFRSAERAEAVCVERGYRIAERGWGP
jgi:hypothetical protein